MKQFAKFNLIVFGLLLACSQPLVQENETLEGSGSLNINIPSVAAWLEPYVQNSASRAFLFASAAEITIKQGDITIAGPVRVDLTADFSQDSSSAGSASLENIPAGVCSVEVSVFNSTQSSEVLLAGVLEDVTINRGENTSATVTVFPVDPVVIDMASQGAVDPVSSNISLVLGGEGWYFLDTGFSDDLVYRVSLSTAANGQRLFLFDEDGLYMGQNLADGQSMVILPNQDYYLGLAGIEGGTADVLFTAELDGYTFNAGSSTNLRIPLGQDPKDVYMVFSHRGVDPSTTIPTVSKSSSVADSEPSSRALNSYSGSRRTFALNEDTSAARGSEAITASNEALKGYLSSSPSSRSIVVEPQPARNLIVGTNTLDYRTSIDDPNETVPMVLRGQANNIPTAQGNKSLFIWVANDSWTDTGTKANLVTQTMVDAIIAAFLATGSDNDIYDWVTALYGEEWGPTGYNNLIAETNEINIVLFDIYDDNSTTGGTVGYFWMKDNLTQASIPGSNEMIVFALDSVLTATPEGPTWESTDFWFKESMSTLAHEFQHMINFYQRSVVRGVEDPVWINEMLSMITEDLLADKLNSPGPRGIDPTDYTAGSPFNQSGRLPVFNLYNDDSLIYWPDPATATSLDFGRAYAKSYAFGAYLTRNYGEPISLQSFMSPVILMPTPAHWRPFWIP
jgi:hypothetical protein